MGQMIAYSPTAENGLISWPDCFHKDGHIFPANAGKVRSQISDKVLITGSASSGLAADAAQRIVNSVNKKQSLVALH